MSQGTVFLPEPRPEDDKEQIGVRDKPVVVLQPPGFTFWYSLFIVGIITFLNIFVV